MIDLNVYGVFCWHVAWNMTRCFKSGGSSVHLVVESGRGPDCRQIE